ncbi:MAG: signal recognition particle-docking protein FtsY [Candidatus Micrarchaeia archaeon]
MFGLLKQKITGFINALTGRAEKKLEEEKKKKEEERRREEEGREAEEKKKRVEEAARKRAEEKRKEEEGKRREAEEKRREKEIGVKLHEEEKARAAKPGARGRAEESAEAARRKEEREREKAEQRAREEAEKKKIEERTEAAGRAREEEGEGARTREEAEKKARAEAAGKEEKEPGGILGAVTSLIARPLATLKKRKEKEAELPVRLSLETTLRGLVFNEIEIKHKDIDDLLENLELSLLEADVALEAAKAVNTELQERLVGRKVRRGEIGSVVKTAVKETLAEVMSKPHADLLELAGQARAHKKPFKILFLGPNGAGKTTTMAKLAHMLMQKGFTCLFSASDTWRAAAMEQTAWHAAKLGIKSIQHKYGADPAAVAFDAINYAAAHGIDVVLIDSAGRQETNINLLDELKKIARVTKPDLKLFIGESIAGHAIVEQVRTFNAAVGLDGVILTKLDCDAKGGTALSIARATGVPIWFIGTGQSYADLIPFDPRAIAEQIMS